MEAREIVRLAKTPVTLLLMLGILAFAANWAIKAVSVPAGRTSIPCVMTDVGGVLTPDKVVVRVLNTGTTAGLAKTTANRLRVATFYIQKYANSTEKVDKTTIVGYAADSPEVQLVMAYFQDAVFRADGRADHSVDVLLANTLTWADAPPANLPVPGPVCINADRFTTPSAVPSTPAPTSAPS